MSLTYLFHIINFDFIIVINCFNFIIVKFIKYSFSYCLNNCLIIHISDHFINNLIIDLNLLNCTNFRQKFLLINQINPIIVIFYYLKLFLTIIIYHLLYYYYTKIIINFIINLLMVVFHFYHYYFIKFKFFV